MILKPLSVRGLAARVKWAQARILAVTNPEVAENLYVDALYMAQDDGYRDSADGWKEPPMLLVDIPRLVDAWKYGYRAGEESEHSLLSDVPFGSDDTWCSDNSESKICEVVA